MKIVTKSKPSFLKVMLGLNSKLYFEFRRALLEENVKMLHLFFAVINLIVGDEDFRKSICQIARDQDACVRIGSHATGRNASHRVRLAVEKGKLIPQPCESCGEKEGNIDAHHPDYKKPLEVIWLCRSCHKLLHSGKLKLESRAATLPR
jgi:hypothetical protein